MVFGISTVIAAVCFLIPVVVIVVGAAWYVWRDKEDKEIIYDKYSS